MVGSPVGNSVDGKVGWKSSLEKFSSSRGDLMVVEDSEDEGGVVGLRFDHYMGCQSWNRDKTLTQAFHGFDTM